MFSDDVKNSLKELFSWAAGCYRDWRKESFGKENEYIHFGVEEPEVQKHYGKLKKFFLGSNFDKSKLFLEALEGNAKSVPPASEEELFSRCLEALLEWAGIALSPVWTDQSVEKLINEFEQGLGSRPMEVTIIPVFGLYTDGSFWRDERFSLSHNVEFGFLNKVEQELLANEAKRTGSFIGAPKGFVNIIPPLSVVVKRPLHVDPKALKKNIDLAIQNFRVFCGGLWGADIDIPFQFIGTRHPFSPWQYTGGRHPRKFEDRRGFKNIGDRDWKILEKYWPMLHPNVLEKYAVTASRLTRSTTRGHWTDKVVDIAIALEGLFDGKHALNFRYQTILPVVVGETFEQRKNLFGVVKELMDLRNNIVHGNTLDDDKNLAEKFKEMDPTELGKHMENYLHAVRSFFSIQLLNEELRSTDGQQDFLLGKSLNIVRLPTP